MRDEEEGRGCWGGKGERVRERRSNGGGRNGGTRLLLLPTAPPIVLASRAWACCCCCCWASLPLSLPAWCADSPPPHLMVADCLTAAHGWVGLKDMIISCGGRRAVVAGLGGGCCCRRLAAAYPAWCVEGGWARRRPLPPPPRPLTGLMMDGTADEAGGQADEKEWSEWW